MSKKSIVSIVTILFTYICLLSNPAVGDELPQAHYKWDKGQDADVLVYYTISTPGQLSGLRRIPEPGVPVLLTCDILLNSDENPTGKSFVPIQNFTGTLNGQGHTIRNIYVNSPNTDKVGLFAQASGSILNITITGQVRGKTDVGSLVGYFSSGIISNIMNKCNVYGYLETGGIAGYAGGNVTASKNYGKVTSEYIGGGIAGTSANTIESCMNYADINIAKSAAGGITAGSSKKISNCINYGNISAQQQAGGISGPMLGTISNCINNGSVKCDFYGGGIASRLYSGSVSDCANNALISGKNNIGGITSYNDGHISSCRNTADVTANTQVGGIVAANKGTINDCDNTGVIMALAKLYAGGIAGTNESTGKIENSYTESGKTDNIIGENKGTVDENSSSRPSDSFDKPGYGQEITLSKDTVISTDSILTVEISDKLTVLKDVTLTDNGTVKNDGTITVKSKGTIIIGETGKIIGSGIIIVDPGGSIVNNSKDNITINDNGTNITVPPSETYTGQNVKSITVVSTAEEGGSISPSGKILISEGESITFTITPNNGYEIENIAVDGEAIGAVTSCSFNDIEESHTIQAFFKYSEANNSFCSNTGGGCNASASSAVFVSLLLFLYVMKRKFK